MRGFVPKISKRSEGRFSRSRLSASINFLWYQFIGWEITGSRTVTARLVRRQFGTPRGFWLTSRIQHCVTPTALLLYHINKILIALLVSLIRPIHFPSLPLFLWRMAYKKSAYLSCGMFFRLNLEEGKNLFE